MSPPILYDLTEFLRHPLRAGIARVVYEVIAHWPRDEAPLVGVRLGTDGQLHSLPPQTLDVLRDYFTVPERSAAARDWLAAVPAESYAPLAPGDLAEARALLNTEMFTDWDRLAFYDRLLDEGHGLRLFFLVYDMLPWVQPEWFHQSIITFPLGYLRLLRRLPNLAFISEQTRQDFLQRVLRAPSAGAHWPVVPLGSDGLGTAEPAFDPGCRHFAAIGTLEPRKNPLSILDAFSALWAEGADVRLSWAGRMGWLTDEDRARVEQLAASEPRFRWLPDADDATVRDVVRSSRATLYVSWAEGYGLPPLESLALGVPVVVSAGLPSLATLEPWGQVRLKVPSAAQVGQAVRRLLDDDFARQKTEEVRRLRLPRWADLAQAVASWVLEGGFGLTAPTGTAIRGPS